MKNRNLNHPVLLMLDNHIMEIEFTNETLAINYKAQDNKFHREFGEMMNEREVNPYLDFLTGKVSLS